MRAENKSGSNEIGVRRSKPQLNGLCRATTHGIRYSITAPPSSRDATLKSPLDE